VRKIFIRTLTLFDKFDILKASNLLTKPEKYKLVLIIILQVFLGALDLLGIVSIGALGALAIQGLESHSPGNKVETLLRIFHINSMSFQTQIAVLGVFSSLVLIFKTVASVLLNRKIFYFLNHKSADISSRLISKMLRKNLVDIQKRSTQEILYIITNGTASLMNGILATAVTVISDSAVILILSFGLFLIDPIILLTTIFLFTTIGVILQYALQKRAKNTGILVNSLTIESNQKILEVLYSYRESVVRNRRDFYAEEIGKIRHKLANNSAETNFLPYISKYVIEAASVFASLCLAAYEFGSKNAVHAVAVLAVFTAASSRIAPAVLRVQQGLLLMKNSSGGAESTFKFIEELEGDSYERFPLTSLNLNHDGFVPSVVLNSVNFRYSAASSFALSDVSLSIKAGTSVAIVGPSGAGKTTLIDLILGVLVPSSGQILISGLPPQVCSAKWSGSISYVPQEVFVSAGSFKENVALGYLASDVKDEYIWEALKLAELEETVLQNPKGIYADVGEDGTKISGGQRQRLGIARALVTRPKLLVLDEATSALDGQTEFNISKSISKLSGHATLIIVAHRLATVREVDQIIYLENGRVLATGSFDEVRKKISNFDRQAKLMGL
jgi:ABC-type bacteriocin/lantibiotic exporter with double-glycine peptidase domain